MLDKQLKSPSWTIYFCTDIHMMYIFSVIPSNCSAALLSRKNAVTSHTADILLSFSFKHLNVLANVTTEYSVTKTAAHRKKKAQSSPYCFHVNLRLCGWFTYY